jgi:predicted secreted protein
VVVKVDGMTERLALVVDESPKPGFKTIRLQDGRSPTKFSTAVRRVVEAEIMREATLEERLKGLSL